uniref:Trehalase n=1 Tax=Laticauda laticaudata TaxID=8630 RepID=A0A8C5RK34_LATLA
MPTARCPLAVGIKEQLSPALLPCFPKGMAPLHTSSALPLQPHLLHWGAAAAVQRARLFQDDKDFVDMPLKSNPGECPPQSAVLFPGPESPCFHHGPIVWRGAPEWRNWLYAVMQRKGCPFCACQISDEKLRSWGRVLNAKWKQLGRQVTSPWRYSLIYVPNPVIVPGGRFREYYYWDSFWILEGLLLSNMAATAKGLIQNFLYLVSKFGHIPNGGQVYYKRRSQPPLLSPMMESYLSHTNDTEFLREHTHLYHFWQDHRAVNISVGGKQYSLNCYSVQVGEPRPKSYMKDVELAKRLREGNSELLSVAESGWDFSSRWFLPGFPSLQHPLQDTRVREIVPVDLNAILCKVEQLLATFYQVLGEKWDKEGKQVAALTVWLDYHFLHQRHNPAFYPCNLSPLWAECDVDLPRAEKMLRYLEESSALSYANGLPTSLTQTGEQWDFPDAWAPLQHMVITGLVKPSSAQARELAFSLAQQWLQMNLAVYEKHGGMFEKWGAYPDQRGPTCPIPLPFPLQEGFGWTNGVALQLLDLYGDQLTSASVLCSPARAWIGTYLVLISRLPGFRGDGPVHPLWLGS